MELKEEQYVCACCARVLSRTSVKLKREVRASVSQSGQRASGGYKGGKRELAVRYPPIPGPSLEPPMVGKQREKG